MPEKFERWDAADYIETPEDAVGYLEACIDEDPGDGSLIRAALGDVARAQKNMAQLARTTEVERSTLYRALSENGNPTFATVLKVMRALGLQLSVKIAEPTQARDQTG